MTGGVPVNGLAATAASQGSSAGQGRAAVSGITRPFAHHGFEIDADRAAAHRPDRQRDGQRHERVRLSGERGQPLSDVDVGCLDHTSRVELGQQSGGPRDHTVVERVDGLDGAHGVRPPVEQIGQLGDQGRRWCPREDPGRVTIGQRGVLPAHAAQIEVEHATQMATRVVARLPPAQVAVDDDDVQQGLEWIVGVHHGRCQSRGL